jgi:hypothetical protein
VKKFLGIFLLLLTVSFGVSAQDKATDRGAVVEPKGKKFAVLVGVNDYEKLRKLRYAKNDILAMRDQLCKIGFEKENVFCLTTGETEKERPTKQRIENTIFHVTELAGPNDVLFLMMAGHGIETNEGQSRFCPVETDSKNLLTTTVPVSDVFGALERCKATFKLMIIDACRDDPFQGRSATARSLQTLNDPPQGCVLFQSCAKDEESLEDDETRHGIFSYYLLEGLGGKAADKGQITLLGLAKYVTEQTQRKAYQIDSASRQRPYLRGELHDFVLSAVLAENLEQPPQTDERMPSVVPENTETAKLEIENSISIFDDELLQKLTSQDVAIRNNAIKHLTSGGLTAKKTSTGYEFYLKENNETFKIDLTGNQTIYQTLSKVGKYLQYPELEPKLIDLDLHKKALALDKTYVDILLTSSNEEGVKILIHGTLFGNPKYPEMSFYSQEFNGLIEFLKTNQAKLKTISSNKDAQEWASILTDPTKFSFTFDKIEKENGEYKTKVVNVDPSSKRKYKESDEAYIQRLKSIGAYNNYRDR